MTLAVCCLAAALWLWPTPNVAARMFPDKHPRASPRPAGATPDADLPASTIAVHVLLFAACCRAGLSPGTAAAAVADAYPVHPWPTIAALSALGISPERAWRDAADIPGLDQVARLVCMSDSHGSHIAAGCDRIGADIRASARDEALTKAERSAVMITMPLTLCFLPAFIILGLAPVVISLGQNML